MPPHGKQAPTLEVTREVKYEGVQVSERALPRRTVQGAVPDGSTYQDNKSAGDAS